MLKPDRAWVVGDEVFKTYDGARTYLVSRRKLLQRKNLIDFIHETVGKDATSRSLFALGQDIADTILARYELKLRK